MKSPVRSLVLALGLVVAVIGCSGPQGAPDGASDAAAGPVDASTLEVVAWDPKTTTAGQAFNVQADGNSGIYFELSGDLPRTDISATIAGKPLSGVIASGKVVTATIPAEYLAAPGEYPVEIQVPAQAVRIPVGTFTVQATDGAAVEAPAGSPAADGSPTP